MARVLRTATAGCYTNRNLTIATPEDDRRRPVLTSTIVNVASVPQSSPFRYPGGKTWLIPVVRRWLQSLGHVAQIVEPFAGGAVVSLTAVFEGLAGRAVLVERDPDVASVWKTLLNGRANWLANRIRTFQLTQDSVRETLARKPRTVQERAFTTILKNRVQRGGILAPGAGQLKRGESGRGLRSRWYPETLGRRIDAISLKKKRLSILEGDGLEVMAGLSCDPCSAFFIDPPYTKAGRRLYSYSDLDHELLFRTVARLEGDFLMTYDDCDEISALARRFSLRVERVAMRSTGHATKRELLIAKDLSWLT